MEKVVLAMKRSPANFLRYAFNSGVPFCKNKKNNMFASANLVIDVETRRRTRAEIKKQEYKVSKI